MAIQNDDDNETEEQYSKRLQEGGMAEGEANMMAAIAFGTGKGDVVEVD